MGMQLNINLSTIAPNAGGQSWFPVSDSKGWLCKIVETGPQETKAKDGTMLVLTLEGLEGPVMGRQHVMRLNVINKSDQAKNIALGTLSAIGHAIGVVNVGNSDELKGKPFRIITKSTGSAEYPDQTEDNGVRDQNGNKPTQAGMTAGQNNGGQNFNGNNQGQNGGGQGFTGNNGNNGGQAGGAGGVGGNFGGGQPQGNGQQFGGQNGGGQGFDPNANNGQNGGQNFQGQQNGGQQFGGNNNGGGQFNPNGGGQPNWGQQ